jgi:excisionase family DNA binding protein
MGPSKVGPQTTTNFLSKERFMDYTRRTGDELLTSRQVAKMLGVKESTLAAWRHHGNRTLRFVRHGNLVRYRFADVQNFINEGVIDPSEH